MAVSRSWPAWIRAARVIHPFPTIANVFATGLFAAVAVGGAPAVDKVIRLLAVMFCAQSAIGATNDIVDVDLDRRSKPWKPLVARLLSLRTAWIVAITAAAVACGVAATFGLGAWALAMGGLLCGLSYNGWLKRTRFSIVPYLIALPLLPLWVWVALGRYTPSLLWEYPLGLLIGMSLYLGNTAPDIPADAAAGVAGTAHRLGTRRTLLAAWGSLALALVLALVLAPLAGYRVQVVLFASAGGAVCLAAAVVVSLRSSAESSVGSAPALQRAWGLLIAGSLMFGVGWLAAAP